MMGHLKELWTVLSLAAILFSVRSITTMNYKITKEWNDKSANHNPASISLSWQSGNDYVTAIFEAPFFDDPAAPKGEVGRPFPKLWDYEVVEIFFLSSKSQEYLEVEVSPHGQHLLLLLKGVRNMIEDELPMNYTASIDLNNKTWKGHAHIPLAYFPRSVDRMNAYAIHGSNEKRVYEALYPTPEGKFPQPDFHRLEYFEDFDLWKIVTDSSVTIGNYWNQFPKT
ncbi:UPF0462 protein C4orf33 homolog [Clytia hemisphaerica]|uniref:UPF0462 protein C4orf33 homolog n=1 Tax=Clytia hemisphaerica TaxID=252671 RepID=UPI0034D4A5A2